MRGSVVASEYWQRWRLLRDVQPAGGCVSVNLREGEFRLRGLIAQRDSSRQSKQCALAGLVFDWQLVKERRNCYCYTSMAMYLFAMLAIRLEPEIEARLTALAKRTGRTKTFYAREAILEHLEDLEDVYLAEKRLQEDGEKLSLKEMKNALGL